MKLIKCEITNSVNDDENVSWFFSDSDNKITEWKKEKKKEIDNWNNNKDIGIISKRYIYFEEYDINSFMELSLINIKDFKIKDLFEIFKTLS